MKTAQLNAIIDHGIKLGDIFPTSHKTGVDLCKWLRRMENKANRLATDYCNGAIDGETWEVESEKIVDRVNEMLGNESFKVPVFLNGDCRGYALKIEDSYIRENGFDIYRDWGGYGILAPEL